MAMLRPSPLREDQFTLANNILTTEISDLGPSFKFQRVYDDSADWGLTLVRTGGADVVYYVSREMRDGENELQGWELVATRSGQPGMMILND